MLGGEGLVWLGLTEPCCSALVTGTALPVAAQSAGLHVTRCFSAATSPADQGILVSFEE